MVTVQRDVEGKERFEPTRRGWFAVACLMVTVLSPMAWDVVKTEVARPVEMQQLHDDIKATATAIDVLAKAVVSGRQQDDARDVIIRQQLDVQGRQLDSDHQTLDEHGHRIDWLENTVRSAPSPRPGDRRPGTYWPK